MSFLSLARRVVVFAILLTISWSANAQFVTIWKTDNPGASASNQVAINRGNSGSYNISWEEVGNEAANNGIQNNINTPNYTLDLPNAGTYRITITGSFNYFLMGGSPDAGKLLSVEQWGTVAWTSFSNSFATCSNVVINAADSPNLSACTSLHQAFQAATSVNTGFQNWNVSNIQDFSGMFSVATSFNDDITGWNTSNATDMTQMFAGATSFNRDISSWNVSNVTNMKDMFRLASSFNQNINGWDVGNVTSMIGTFSNTDAFNQPLDNWNVSNVTAFDQMFSGAIAFNQDIDGWNVSSGTGFSDMFSGAVAFDKYLGNWNMSNCILASGMFEGAAKFNQEIGTWDMSSNTDLSRMFNGATQFNGDVSSWNVSNVTAMSATFQNATSFNRNISSWNVANVTDMSNMLDNSGLSDPNYENILTAWSALPVQDNVSFGALTKHYCAAKAAHDALITTHSWIITDGGLACVPTVTSFTPTFGAAGATIEITGADFTGTSEVSFGGTAAASFTVNSPTSITAVVGSGATGSVLVATPAGSDSKAGFFFLFPPPTITSFAPTSAGTGTTVVITGTNLSETTAVNFGGTAAKSFTVVSPTQINAVVGGGSTGILSLATFSGTAFLGGFTFIVQPAPNITSFSPKTGTTGTKVIIKGTNFIGVTAVQFGGVDATSFDVASGTTINAFVSSGATGDVSVTTPGGTTTEAGFTFVPGPTVLSFSPTAAAGGDVVTIKGENFTDATSVTFGDTPASSFTIVSDTIITAVVSGLGKSGIVLVTSSVGSGGLDGFVFLLPVIVVKDRDNNTGNQVSSDQTVDLGSVFPDESIRRTLTISNTGNATMVLLGIDLSNPSFSVVESPTEIDEGDFKSLTIQFSSTSVGVHTTDVVVRVASGSFTFHLKVDVKPQEIEVFNAVTPNGDGAHDFLKIKHIEQYSGTRVVILDRIGNEVFRMDDYNNDMIERRFEGYSNVGNTKALTDGTYYYMIDTGTDKYTGFLLLQR